MKSIPPPGEIPERLERLECLECLDRMACGSLRVSLWDGAGPRVAQTIARCASTEQGAASYQHERHASSIAQHDGHRRHEPAGFHSREDDADAATVAIAGRRVAGSRYPACATNGPRHLSRTDGEGLATSPADGLPIAGQAGQSRPCVAFQAGRNPAFRSRRVAGCRCLRIESRRGRPARAPQRATLSTRSVSGAATGARPAACQREEALAFAGVA